MSEPISLSINDIFEIIKELIVLIEPNPEDLIKLVQTKMPYGKYAGIPLIDLPEPYVVWFNAEGLPSGELGRLFGLLYEVKSNGLEYLFEPLKGLSFSE